MTAARALGSFADDYEAGAFLLKRFTSEPSEAFDPEYMTQLFDLGYEKAVRGYPWGGAPPGFLVPEKE